MTHHPIQRRPTTSGLDPGTVDDLLAADQPPALTPAQRAQLHAIVAHAVAIASHEVDEHISPAVGDNAAERSPLAEPGVWIVLVMLALVTIVALVALAAVLGLAAIGA